VPLYKRSFAKEQLEIIFHLLTCRDICGLIAFMKFPDFDDETKEKMRMVMQGGLVNKTTPPDFRKMSDEKLDGFISKNSNTIYILAATDERKRRDNAKAGEAEKARYQSANRQSLFAIGIAAISLAIAN